ncbi:sensor histidine kinase [Desulfocurvus sp. DL9XJH121]
MRAYVDELHDPAYYRSLRRSVAAMILLASLTPLALVGGISAYQFHVSYEAKVLAQLSEMVQKHQQNIDFFLSEKLGDLRLMARLYDYPRLADEEFLKTRLKLLQEEFRGAFVDLGVVDGRGMQRAYAGPFMLEQADYSEARWFRQAMHSEVYISDVFLGLRGLPHFIIAVRGTHRGQPWILRATIDFMAFDSLVENIRIGRTGAAFIVSREGRFQTTPPPGGESMDTSRFVRVLTDMRTPEGDAGWSPMGREAVVQLRTGPTGLDTVYVMTPLKGGEWLLVYQQDEDDAFASLLAARRTMVAVMLLGAAGIVLTALYLARRIVRYIERADAEKAVMNDQVIEAGKMAAIGELASGIAHEINNPVAIMLEEAGWVGDVAGDLDLPDKDRAEIAASLSQIRTQGARCREITHKLLSFARRIDPTVMTVDLNKAAREVVGLSEQRARYDNIEFAMDFAPELPCIRASASELQQVLLNLVNNSIDAIGPGGGDIRIFTRQDKGGVVLGVEDSGEGIPKANLSRIFDPFFTTKPVGKGTGLGLSIIYGIIKKMGGEVDVDSVPGQGTTFTLHFPESILAPQGEEDGHV